MNDFSRLKSMVTVEMILAHYGLLDCLRKKAGGYVGPCPIHQGTNPNPQAFHINQKGLWHCFSHCQRGGDKVDFIRLLEHGSYVRTKVVLTGLAGRSSLPLKDIREPSITGTRCQPETGEEQPKQPFVPFSRCLHLIHQHPRFTSLGLSGATLAHFEAGFWPGAGFLKNCLAVRVHDPGGKPLTYIGRRLDPIDIQRLGKWRMPSSFPKHELLYNLHRARRWGDHGMIIVEGPWDVMKVTQAGFPAVVALLGTTISPEQIVLLREFSPLILLFDGDPAGQKVAAMLPTLVGNQPTITCTLPNDHDPASLTENEIHNLLSVYFPGGGPVPPKNSGDQRDTMTFLNQHSASPSRSGSLLACAEGLSVQGGYGTNQVDISITNS